MVYRRGVGVTALCALGLSAASISPSVYAQANTTTSTLAPMVSAVETLMPCGISDGDKRFGIQVIEDSGCKWAGLGCYNDHCRYCMATETPKSAHLEACATFGATFPTVKQATTSTGPCVASGGDVAVGISAITDADCMYGGLGCFGGHCRFCKMMESPFSSHLMDCPELNTARETLEPSVSTTESPTTPTDAATELPIATTAVPETESPIVVTEVPETEPPVIATAVPETEAPNVATESPPNTESPAVETESPIVITEVPETETPIVANVVPETEAPIAATESPPSTDSPAVATNVSSVTPDDSDMMPTEPVFATEWPFIATEEPGSDMQEPRTAFGNGASSSDEVPDLKGPGSDGSHMEPEDPSDIGDFWDTMDGNASFDDDMPVEEKPGSESSNLSSEEPGSDFLEPWGALDNEASYDDGTSETEAPFAIREESGSDDQDTSAGGASSEAYEEADATPSCEITASELDIADGFSIVTDITCTADRWDCISNVCCLCRVLSTAKSYIYTDCADIGSS